MAVGKPGIFGAWRCHCHMWVSRVSRFPLALCHVCILACRHCFWEGTAAAEEDGGPSWLALPEDFWSSPAWDVAGGPLVRRAGGKPRVEL